MFVNELDACDNAGHETTTIRLVKQSSERNIVGNVALHSKLVDHVHRPSGVDHVVQSQLCNNITNSVREYVFYVFFQIS